MALWETQGPCRSHKSEPFMHNALRMTGSVVKQRRGGTRSIATTRGIEGTKIIDSSTSTFDYGTKALSSSPFSNVSRKSVTQHTSHTKSQQQRPRSASSTRSHYVPRPPPRAYCVRPPAMVRSCAKMQGLLTQQRCMFWSRYNSQQGESSRSCSL